MSSLDEFVEEIARLPEDWHGAGSVGKGVLRAIVAHAERLGTIRHSVETGAGKTTLLFSRLSKDHMVFAVDAGNSISQVKKSPLFSSGNVTFVEGPSQLTLPHHVFENKIDMALIDGPHGYPFPDLEYYYFYPNIKKGGLLLIDDIQIPTIARMHDIIKSGDMFNPLEVVENMAFFERTEAPLINPLSDSWWLQGYNREYYHSITAPKEARHGLLRGILGRSWSAFRRSLLP